MLLLTSIPTDSELLTVTDLQGAFSSIPAGKLGYRFAFTWTEMPQGSRALLTVHKPQKLNQMIQGFLQATLCYNM